MGRSEGRDGRRHRRTPMRPVAALLTALSLFGCAPDTPMDETTCQFPSRTYALPSCAPTPEPWEAPTVTIVQYSLVSSPTTTIVPLGGESWNAAIASAVVDHEGSTPSTSTTVPAGPFRGTVEQWRPLVTTAITHFGGNGNDVDRFLRIMQCESGGDPDAKNPNSSASGLMQHLTRFWPDRAASAGRPGADVFDAEANIWVSAWLALAAPGGGWQHWVCK